MSKRMNFGTHVLILGWFNVVASVIFLFIGLMALVFLSGMGIVAEDEEATRILSMIGCAGFVLLGFFAVPGFIAGYGLLARRPWGRIAGIVVAILDLFNIPIGTAFGIYALWVLTEPEAEEYFAVGPAPPRGSEAVGS